MEQKKNQNKSVLTYAILGILLLVFGYYSATMNYAHAVSVVNVTGFPSGTVTRDVTYRTDTSNSDTTAYIIGNNGAQAFVWKKSGSTNTIIANVSLTGAIVGTAIAYNKDNQFIYAKTDTKFFKLTTNLGIAGSLSIGGAEVRKLIYDDTHDLLYFCTNDSYGTVNQVTLATTGLYTDAGANTIFDCDIDEINNIMYLAGSGIGASATCEALKITLNTHIEQDCASFAGVDATLFGVCYDSGDNKIWYSSSAGSKVKKLDSDLNLVVDVAVGTVPRYCTISPDTGARRLYQNIEGTDSVSIIDIDANSVLSTQVVCDLGTSSLTPHTDVKRLFNTTNTYIPCPVSTTTNRVIIDDTVSEAIPDVDPDSCDNPANANLLRCRLADGEDITGIGEVVGTGVTDLACNVIFVDCSEDTNPATNGIGLLIFIASIFVVIGMFYYSIGKDAFNIPLFIYVVIILALSAFFTITGLIDPVFLILSIVAIVALASPKLISTIRGSTFGGGSTA